MKKALAMIALLVSAAAPAARAEAVRIGLFDLFRPRTIEVGVASGEGAVFGSGASTGEARLARGDRVRVRMTGSHLSVTVADGHGRVRHSFLAREAVFSAGESGLLELSLPEKMRRVVRGQVAVSPAGEGGETLRVVLTTDREDAVASIAAAEMSGERRVEAIKALAVAARTYMLAHGGRHADEGYDFCDTTHCQVYRGESDLAGEAARPLIAASVRATAGEHLAFAGRGIEGYYTAACGGQSATPEMVWGGSGDGYPYRRASCQWCRGSRYSRWERSAAATSVLNLLSEAAKLKLSASAEVRTVTGPGDFVRAVIIEDRGREVSMSSDEFRRALGRGLGWNTVLSPTFTIRRRGQHFIFRGRGFGSQVGLCLAGASAQAAAGRSYREILSFYYPGAAVETRGGGVKGGRVQSFDSFGPKASAAGRGGGAANNRPRRDGRLID